MAETPFDHAREKYPVDVVFSDEETYGEGGTYILSFRTERQARIWCRQHDLDFEDNDFFEDLYGYEEVVG